MHTHTYLYLYIYICTYITMLYVHISNYLYINREPDWSHRRASSSADPTARAPSWYICIHISISISIYLSI